MPSPDIAILGRTLFRSERKLFGILQPDRMFHMYLVGKTGVGKSTLLESMAVQDPAAGRGQSNGWNFPRWDVVDHVLLNTEGCVTSPAALVLQTEQGMGPVGAGAMSDKGFNVGDIVITTSCEVSFTVSGSGEVSPGYGPDEREAAGPPATFPFDDRGCAPRERCVPRLSERRPAVE